VQDVQLRGEYLYAAMGAGGFRIFDVANVDVKDVSQRVITAPVSPLGQRFYLKTKFATAVASPSTLALDPLRTQIKENEEQSIAPLYAFLYVTDKYEGLIVVGDPKTGVGTLLDGNPRNNFLKRATPSTPRANSTARAASPSPEPTPTSSATAAWRSSISPTRCIRRSPPRSARPNSSRPPASPFSSATPSSPTTRA
jgi:hypothetical protein